MTYKLREKYKDYIENDGGIFTSAKRKRLLKYSPGRKGYSEEPAQFRYDVRRFVQQAFVDLELFIEAVDKKDVNRTINLITIEPVLETYFQVGKGEFAEKDSVKADLAWLLINIGFRYLRWPSIAPIPDYEKVIMDQALTLSQNLANRMKQNIKIESTKEGSS